MTDKFQTEDRVLPPEAAGLRLDQALAAAFPQYSRSQLQRWLRDGHLRVGGGLARSSARVAGGETVCLQADFPRDDTLQPEAIPLEIVHSDPALLVLNKPAGLVVHPGAGNRLHTLQHALLAHDAGLARVPRAGLVHRLDKDTTGLMVVARTPEAHTRLVAAMQARDIGREYLALCSGRVTAGGSIDQPIGRHRTLRTRMAVRSDGRAARTHYRVAERFDDFTLLRVRLETGRTHQIRVHLAHIGHPVVGDPEYAARRALVTRDTPPLLAVALQGFPRQALHAARLELTHPVSGKELAFEAPLPEDFARLLQVLRNPKAVVAPKAARKKAVKKRAAAKKKSARALRQ